MSKWSNKTKQELSKMLCQPSLNKLIGFDSLTNMYNDIRDKRNPTSLLSVGDKGRFQKISSNSPQNNELVKEWDDETKSLIRWFKSNPVLPKSPFQLKPCHTIIDSQKFYESLKNDISEGPTGPRSLFGALKCDLRCLKNLHL